MTRAYAILGLILSLCFAQNSQAANFYWGGRALVSQFELADFKLNIKGVPGYDYQTVDLHKDTDTKAVGAALFTGLDFNRAGNVPLRIEYEASLQNVDHSLRVKDGFRTTGFRATVFAEAEVEISTAFSQSLNLWLDIPVGKFQIKPYIGGALGMTYIFYDADAIINRGSGIPAFEASASRSGHKRAYYYSLGGGARLALSKRTFLDLTLRYQEKEDFSINMYPLGLEFSSQGMDIGLSLQYYF